MPPSAMQGTPAARQAWAASYTAVSCGTPTPATIRVVQRAGANTDLHGVRASLNHGLSTGAGADVAADDLHAVEGGVVLQAGNHVECQTGLTVGGVDHEHVHASLHQSGGTLPGVAEEADAGGHAQTTLLILGGRPGTARS